MIKHKIEIHERAIRRGKAHLQSEIDVIESIQEVDVHQIYRDYGCGNLGAYVCKYMGFTEAVAWNFITVARKAKDVPALQKAISMGELQVQKARKVTAVINKENQDFWVRLAVEQPQRVVEKEVAKVKPEEAKPERVKYISDDRLNLSVNITETFNEKLKRVMDLESQRTKRARNREESIEAALDAYLEKYDPIEKAKRVQKKQEAKQTVQSDASAPVSRQLNHRPARPASLEHQRNLRDQGQCTHTENGIRCQERRWLHTHHIKPVSQGGQDTLENLTTLCFGHHRLIHHPNKLSDQVFDYHRQRKMLLFHESPVRKYFCNPGVSWNARVFRGVS